MEPFNVSGHLKDSFLDAVWESQSSFGDTTICLSKPKEKSSSGNKNIYCLRPDQFGDSNYILDCDSSLPEKEYVEVLLHILNPTYFPDLTWVDIKGLNHLCPLTKAMKTFPRLHLQIYCKTSTTFRLSGIWENVVYLGFVCGNQTSSFGFTSCTQCCPQAEPCRFPHLKSLRIEANVRPCETINFACPNLANVFLVCPGFGQTDIPGSKPFSLRFLNAPNLKGIELECALKSLETDEDLLFDPDHIQDLFPSIETVFLQAFYHPTLERFTGRWVIPCYYLFDKRYNFRIHIGYGPVLDNKTKEKPEEDPRYQLTPDYEEFTRKLKIVIENVESSTQH
jgi:hypothetical protein